MAGGPILPSSIYVGGAAGSLAPTFYVPGTNTNTAGVIEGVGVVANLNTVGVDAPGVFQFNLPEVIPTGTMKCRILAWANAATGNAKYTLADAGTAPGNNIGATTLTTDASAVTLAWGAGDNDDIKDVKVNLTGPGVTANNIFTVLMTWNSGSWTLAQTSVWQLSLIWE
jgi:hypothetical protein